MNTYPITSSSLLVSSLKHALVGVLLVLNGGANAQSKFPNRPLQIVVPSVPGGGMDITARLVGSKLAESLGQPVLVVNKPGADGQLAYNMVARSPADGHVILECPISIVTNAYLHKDARYDVLKDFVPISKAVTVSNVLVVNSNLPVKTVNELIALARTRPGELNNAHSGVGAAGFLAGELFMTEAGVRFMNIAYKGGSAAVMDVAQGAADLSFATAASVQPLIRSGRLRALAVTSATRLAELPDVPTIGETAVPGYEASNWYCFMAPAKTPLEIVATLNRLIREALSSPDVMQALRAQGLEPTPGSPEELGTYVRSEQRKWSKLILDRNVKPE